MGPVKMAFLHITSCFPVFSITVSEPSSPHPQKHPLMEKLRLCHFSHYVLDISSGLGSHLFICNVEQPMGLA